MKGGNIMDNRGFTLIELLIVVAIISILASIALPNFLEAQTRAKVSRAKADIRTIYTGLELYFVDNGAYPFYHYAPQSNNRKINLGMFIGGYAFGINQPIDFSSAPYYGANPLTTPVSYLSVYPNDIFYKRAKSDPYESGQYQYTNWMQAYYISGGNYNFYKAYLLFGPYRIFSLGPDGGGPDPGLVYDPTNGTISRGDIFYSPKTAYEVDVSSYF